MKIKSVSVTDIGKVRKENQDEILCNEELSLFAVSDGMGGLLCGKQAAKMSCSYLELFLRTICLDNMDVEEAEVSVKETVEKVSAVIQKSGNEGLRVEYYGATLTGLLVHQKHAIVFNIGDSRVYLLRAGETLQQLTRDDNLYELLSEDPDFVVTQQEAKRYKNQLTQFMGMNVGIVPAVNSIEMHSGDKFLICSDGLTKMLTKEEIQHHLSTQQTLEKQAEALVYAANEAGGTDNISVVLVDVQ